MEKRGRSFLRSSNQSSNQSNKQGNLGWIRSKKAQITIFIIVGIVILFTFVFMIMLTSSSQKAGLRSEQEKIFTQAFNKEGMRIFVEDCLQDELENGLILLGKQGRIWSGQPGGTKEFIAGETGITIGTDNIFYGITREGSLKYKEHPEAYPCDYNENDYTQNSLLNDNSLLNKFSFCHYQYPNTHLGFGKLELRSSTTPSGALAEDLRRYLINRTLWCVENFTKTNISRQAQLEPTEMSLKLEIVNDGINVKVDFPLKFTVAGEEFFHLTNFDFFYPTKFKQFLDAAVIYPFLYDQKYVDFNYEENTLKNPTFSYGSGENYPNCHPETDENNREKNYFSCTGSLFANQYNSLGITLNKVPNINSAGDDLFTFTSPKILNRPVGQSGVYEYKIARQNRPPALDYISRFPCEETEPAYDYLVIKDDAEYGGINIKAVARDPDEDNIDEDNIIKYKFSDKDVRLLQHTVDGQELQIPLERILELSNPNTYFGRENNFFTFTANATDEHGLSDWQIVRVLVDRPITTSMELQLPYEGVTSSQDTDRGKYYFVSKEDPVFVKVTFPSESKAGFRPEITLSYDNNEDEGSREQFREQLREQFSYDLSSHAAGYSNTNRELCYSFPWKGLVGSCNLADYTKEEFTHWKDYLGSEDNLQKYNFFKQLTEKGKLNLTFNIDYCSGNLNKKTSTEATIVVKECVAYKNSQHPWAYPHLYDCDLNFDGTTNLNACKKNENLNPFEATHSCCLGDPLRPGTWKIADENTACFTNPVPGCYGQSKEGYTIGNSGYILEKQIRYCNSDKKRGNVCDGDTKNEYYNPNTGQESELMYCGRYKICTGSTCIGYPECKLDININCAEQLAFGLIKDKGWCMGMMGCSNFCDRLAGKAIVYTTPIASTTQSHVINLDKISRLVKERNIYNTINTDRTLLPYVCGCDSRELEAGRVYKCDSNFDGIFGGICSGNVCNGDS